MIFLAVLLVVLLWVLLRPTGRPDLRHIPTIGSTFPLLSYLGAIRFFLWAQHTLQEGHRKYSSGIFKVAHFNRWMVIITNRQHLEEIRKAPDDVLSTKDASIEILQSDITLGETIFRNPYHIPIIQVELTRNLHRMIPSIHEEIVAGCSRTFIAPQNGEWTTFRPVDCVLKIITRVVNRLFVGQNLDYLEIAANFTTEAMGAAAFIQPFPDSTRRLVARLFPGLVKSKGKAARYLEPVIESRLDMVQKYGRDYPGKSNDMLSWLLDEAQGDELSVPRLTNRILALNLASTHTSTLTLVHTLFHLAASPEEYLSPLRSEIEESLSNYGWTKRGIDEMKLLDSFLKEAQRLNPLGAVLVVRKARQDFMFSDGTFIPAGTFMAVATSPIHLNEERYPNAHEFRADRFLQTGQQFVTTSEDHLAFGHGRNACVGRFLAAVQLKMLLAHLILNYDIKFEVEGVRPPNMWIGTACIPNLRTPILLRKRYLSTVN